MPDTNEWVRVKDKDTGHKLSVRESEIPHGNYDVLKQPAVDEATGLVLEPEFAGDSAAPAAKKTAAKKTSARKPAASKVVTTENEEKSDA